MKKHGFSKDLYCELFFLQIMLNHVEKYQRIYFVSYLVSVLFLNCQVKNIRSGFLLSVLCLKEEFAALIMHHKNSVNKLKVVIVVKEEHVLDFLL